MIQLLGITPAHGPEETPDDWWSCGDYHALNNKVFDQYPIRYTGFCFLHRWYNHLLKDRYGLALPLVLLGIRSAFKEGIACTNAQLVYEITLRLPGEFISTTCSTDIPDATSYVIPGLETQPQVLHHRHQWS